MRNSFASITIAALIVIAPHCVSAQTKDITEFRKGWRFPLELSQGFVGSHQAYAGIASFSAMYTLVPGSLRIGAVAGPMMSGGDVQGLGGARLAWCIVKGPEMIFGTPANVQIQIDHQWSTENFAIVGGGVVVEVGELLLVGARGYWQYDADTDVHPGWLQFSIGLNLFRGKQEHAVPDDPTLHGLTPQPSDDPTH